MAEKEYEKQIAAAKAALESYSAQQNEIAKLYEQAKQNAAADYDRQKTKLASDADRKTNQAAVDMLRTERNIDQTLASRGLAFSGENAQTRLDLTLALRNQLNEIESDRTESEAALERERAAKLADLDLTYAKEKQSAAEKEASLHAELASGIAARDAARASAAASTGKGSGTNGSAGSASGNQTAEKTDAQKALEEFLAKGEPSRRFDSMQYAIWHNELRKLEEAVEKEKQEANALVPEVSARELAKQFVQAAGSNGKIYGYEQQRRMADMLTELQDTYQLTEAYEQQLLLNLRSLGYSPEYVQNMNDQTKNLRDRATEMYTQLYARYMRLYTNAGVGKNERALYAEQAARFDQLAYVYANSESSELFEAAVAAMGLTAELSDFYKQVEKKNKEAKSTKYRLGSNLP